MATNQRISGEGKVSTPYGPSHKRGPRSLAFLPPAFLALAGAFLAPSLARAVLVVDALVPAGNIVVERIDGDDVYLHQDLRETLDWWFYWHCRVRGAAGRTVRFHFTNKNVLGAQGPAYSLDRGVTWRWLGSKRSNSNALAPKDGFVFQFPSAAAEVRFAFAIPYVETNLVQFLEPYKASKAFKREVLCKTSQG